MYTHTLNLGKIVLGIRPEKVNLLPEKNHGALKISVDFVEKLGARQLLYSHTGDDTFVTSLHNGLDSGITECWGKVQEEDIHFFDAKTGKALILN